MNTQVYLQPSWDDWLPRLLAKYQAETTIDELEQASFLTANIIDRLLEAALEKNPDWLSDGNYLANIEKAAMNYLCGNNN